MFLEKSNGNMDGYLTYHHVWALIYSRASWVAEREKASFQESKFLELVFQFRVTVVEIINKQVLQMLVSSSVGVALSLCSATKINELQTVLWIKGLF